MKKQFIISMLLLCGAQGAFGQACGSARDSDLSGNYTSSTSTDQCGGGYGGLQGSLSAPTLQQST